MTMVMPVLPAVTSASPQPGTAGRNGQQGPACQDKARMRHLSWAYASGPVAYPWAGRLAKRAKILDKPLADAYRMGPGTRPLRAPHRASQGPTAEDTSRMGASRGHRTRLGVCRPRTLPGARPPRVRHPGHRPRSGARGECGAPSVLSLCPPTAEKTTTYAPLALTRLRLDPLGPTAPPAPPRPAALVCQPRLARARPPPRRLVGDLLLGPQVCAGGAGGLPGVAACAILRDDRSRGSPRSATRGGHRPPRACSQPGPCLPATAAPLCDARWVSQVGGGADLD
jgi:hypothetical protein